jgi:hypothetical protein
MKSEKNQGTTRNRITTMGVLFSVCLFQVGTILGQEQVYDNFDGNKAIRYGERTGVLDSVAKNPAPGAANNSEKCALYVRNGAKKFANIKMNLPQKLTGVEAYATYEGIPPRIKMKCYTSAPPGTLVEVLLGSKRGNNDYPAGTHSQYQAYTSVSNEWEELEFKFSQVPQGSETAANEIDQIVLLFNPNSSTSDTYYFDDLTGPSLGAATEQTAAADNKNKKDGAAEAESTDASEKKKDNKKSATKKSPKKRKDN